MASKGLLALIFALCLAILIAAPAHAAFSDISDPELSKKADELVKVGIVSGFPDGSFRPDNPLTREQMAKLIVLAKNLPLTSIAAHSLSFEDVPNDRWSSSYIKISAAAEIVRGYTDGTFRPTQQLTRAELARLLFRAINMPAITPIGPSYSDVPVEYWAYREIESVAYYGIMGGYRDRTYRPTQPATRGEIVVAVYNLIKADLKPPVETTTTPTPTETPTPSPQDDGRTIIVIDPGHGGHDPGAIASSTGLKEKDVNLAVALILHDMLKAAGYEIVMTRSTDIFVSLNDRAKIANDANADIFVSVHHNSSTNVTATGTSVYSHPDSQDGSLLASLIQSELVKAFGWAGTPGKDNGVKTANFAVLRETLMTAALSESAFLSNPDEALLLGTEEFRRKEAQGLFNGIVRYLNQLK